MNDEVRSELTSRRSERDADRITEIALDADLSDLGQPRMGTAALVIDATQDQTVMLAQYVLGIVRRAGLVDALRACLISDAMQRHDERMMDALGVPLVERVGKGTEYEAATYKRVQPENVAHVRDPEHTARELMARTITREVRREEVRVEREGRGVSA